MPRLIPESGRHIPFSGLTVDFTDGIVALPSGEEFTDLESRTVHGSLVKLVGEIQYSSASGYMGLVTENDAWQFITAASGTGSSSGIVPNDPLVSGGLIFWGKEDGFQLDGDTASGISGWLDAGPYGHHFTQATDATQPFIESGVLDGKDGAYYAGAQSLDNDGAITTWFDGANESNLTVIVICEFKLDDGTSAHTPGFTVSRNNNDVSIVEGPMHVHWGLGGSGLWRNFIRDSASTNSDIRIDGSVAPPVDDLDTAICLSCTIDEPNHLMEMFRNGVSLFGTQSGISDMNNIAANRSTIGAYRRQSGPISYMVGRIFEIAVYAGPLTETKPLPADQRRAIEKQMMTKWGLV